MNSGSYFTAFNTGTQAANITYTLPTAQGAVGTSLTNDGTGVLTWNRVPFATTMSGATTYLTNTWANYVNGTVSITVPGPGNIVVEANAYMELDHTNGTADNLFLNIGTTATDGGSPYDEVAWTIPSTDPTSALSPYTFTVRKVFNVTAAGTYTYYLNGEMTSGASGSDNFYWCRMIATFY